MDKWHVMWIVLSVPWFFYGFGILLELDWMIHLAGILFIVLGIITIVLMTRDVKNIVNR